MKAIFASLVDDWIRFRWRDTVALVLVFGGIYIVYKCTNTMVCSEAKGIIGAGLIMLDPRAMQRGPSPGTNGVTTSFTEKTTATVPVQTSANQPSADPGAPPNWPAK